MFIQRLINYYKVAKCVFYSLFESMFVLLELDSKTYFRIRADK